MPPTLKSNLTANDVCRCLRKQSGWYAGWAIQQLWTSGFDYVGGTGWNSGKRKVDALDLFADGSYELFGRQHNLMFAAVTANKTIVTSVHGPTFSRMKLAVSTTLMAISYKTDWSPQSSAQDDTTHMKSLYAATRVTLADPLHLILGARYTNWRVDTLTYSMEKNHTTPYAGLVF